MKDFSLNVNHDEYVVVYIIDHKETVIYHGHDAELAKYIFGQLKLALTRKKTDVMEGVALKVLITADVKTTYFGVSRNTKNEYIPEDITMECSRNAGYVYIAYAKKYGTEWEVI